MPEDSQGGGERYRQVGTGSGRNAKWVTLILKVCFNQGSVRLIFAFLKGHSGNSMENGLDARK